MKNTQIGIDIGGTFTDIVVSHNSYISKIKVLSTPSEYSKGVMTGLSEAIKRLKISPKNELGLCWASNPNDRSMYNLRVVHQKKY